MTIPSVSKASNEWAFSGPRFHGPIRAFDFVDAASYEEHIELSGKLPFPVKNGSRISPGDVKEAVRFITERGTGAIRAFRNKKFRDINRQARDLAPEI